MRHTARQLLGPGGLNVQRLRRGRHGGFSNLDEERIVRRHLSDLNPQRVCVDIGASDGVTMSNTYSLYRDGWSGLAVEFDPEKFAALSSRYTRFAQVNLARCKITPANVVAVLDANDLPQEIGFLSLDIDGYDHFVLDRVLSRYRPSLIVVEVNEKIPPPVKFTVEYSPEYSWNADHFYGQSISQLAELCQAFDYALVELEYNNAFLIPVERAATPPLSAHDAYRKGYLDRADRKKKFPWNENVEYWQALEPADAVTEISGYFSSRHGQFTISL